MKESGLRSQAAESRPHLSRSRRSDNFSDRSACGPLWTTSANRTRRQEWIGTDRFERCLADGFILPDSPLHADDAPGPDNAYNTDNASRTDNADQPVHPVNVERHGSASIRLTWSDNSCTDWSASDLRKACPCATCREKKRGEQAAQGTPKSGSIGLPVLSAAEAKPLTIETMRPVGNYAYNIVFSDGHHSGIYTFDVLRKPD